VAAITIALVAASLPVLAAPVDYPAVTPGYRIEFPFDEGSHEQFRTEWWYVTGWLEQASGEPLGFQVTFFRTRPGTQENNPSRFAAKQVLFAHAALSNPRTGKLLRGERSAREGFGLASAAAGDLNVAIDDWFLRREGADRGYRTRVTADAFELDLNWVAVQPALLHGQAGYSQKGPDPVNASYYYSQPQLQIEGQVRMDDRTLQVRGTGWLDHEWSTTYIDVQTQGWDWLGVNLDDGGALMASRMRSADGAQHWAFATWRSASGAIQVFSPAQIEWTARRRWRSARTGIEYPVEWQLRMGERVLRLTPLMDDQESDARASTGTIYWEGATRVLDEQLRPLGRGYLELTGYGPRLRL